MTRPTKKAKIVGAALPASDGTPTPEGTKMYEHWTVVATDFLEEDAKAYVRMNWRDMTPYKVACSMRTTSKKYKDLTDEQFEALWYRQTIAEFRAAKDGFLVKEAEEAEVAKKKEEEYKKQAKEMEAKKEGAAGA